MNPVSSFSKPIYQQIRQLVRQIPRGKVATYGQIAAHLDGCSARMVGYAMAGLPPDSDVPWHRVINASGRISPRGNWESSARQRSLLELEEVVFRPNESIDLNRFGWKGPDWRWLVEHGLDPEKNLDDV